MWTEPRTTFHGRYFHVADAILEPKPVQKARPPVMIAGSGEQMTLRAVARLGEELAARGPLRGFVGTMSEAIDHIGQYRDSVQFLINSDQPNDVETRDLFVSDVMPCFA